MKLIKLPLKLIILPLIAIIWLVCLLAKAATHIACYIIGPLMLLIGVFIAILLFEKFWPGVWSCCALEAACLILLFGTTWMVANMEDLNACLVRFVHS